MIQTITIMLSSEYFWGLISGVVLSFASAWFLSWLGMRNSKRHLRENQKEFCAEIIENVYDVIKAMDENRERNRVIDHEFLALLDAEISIYGRNRENLILLSRPTRAKMRSFMSNVATRRAKVGRFLNMFDEALRESRNLKTSGHEEGMKLMKLRQDDANTCLSLAHQALDRMKEEAARKDALIKEIT